MPPWTAACPIPRIPGHGAIRYDLTRWIGEGWGCVPRRFNYCRQEFPYAPIWAPVHFLDRKKCTGDAPVHFLDRKKCTGDMHLYTSLGGGGIDGIMIPPSIIIIRVSFGGGLGGTTKTTSSGAQRRGMVILGIDLTLTGE